MQYHYQSIDSKMCHRDARRECAIRNIRMSEFYAEFGARAFYNARSILDWLGY